MKTVLFLALLSFPLCLQVATAQIRLTTPASSFTAIAGVQNYAAIIVEGATAGSQAVYVMEGPGMVEFDKTTKRWLWSWQPSIADTGKEFAVLVRAAAASEQCRFTVRPRAFKNDLRLRDLSKGRFYSGIPTNINAKQAGMDGAYAMTLHFDDSIAAKVSEPSLTIRPHLHKEVGKQARLSIEYTAPLTGRQITLASYQTKVKYPPLRVPGSKEVTVGEQIPFMGALGLPPNFYTPIPSPYLLVRSDGYLADTAMMIMGYQLEGDDPFSMFSVDPVTRTAKKATNSFYFDIRQTEKGKTITDPRGKVVYVELFDPVTKQTAVMEIRIFPSRTEAPSDH